MAKISMIVAKYIATLSINAEGIVEKPDVIGAIFGQTEGLLGSELELRELQRSGRIGRIEVELDVRNGKTDGKIILSSSLDKAETAIIGAALETIERIGPCDAKVKVEKLEDVRISKRTYIIERAKELLKQLTTDVLPDSEEMAEEVTKSLRVSEIREYGRDRMPAGPDIETSEEIIVVEGRADVLTLLKQGFRNVIGLNGTKIPPTIIDLSKEKTVTVFVDGDRGGDLILKEMIEIAEVDFVTKAPDGKEVEELTKKEVHKSLRNRIAVEQAKMELDKKSKELDTGRTRFASTSVSFSNNENRSNNFRDNRSDNRDRDSRDSRDSRGDRDNRMERPPQREFKAKAPNEEHVKKIKTILEELIGTRGAYLLDEKMDILGKVPFTEMVHALKGMGNNAKAVVFDGTLDRNLTGLLVKNGLEYVGATHVSGPLQADFNIITTEK